MNVAFFSSEVFPFAKTGGLADVAGALPLALEQKGLTVKIFMPWYKNIKPQKTHKEYGTSTIGKNIEVVFIRQDEYFSRDYLYNTPEGDYPDNLERFSFFSHKALELMKALKFNPGIVHCNDWQTALVIVYLKTLYGKDTFFKKTKAVFTIHNLAFQGYFPQNKFSSLNLPQEALEPLVMYNQLNLLKGGVVYADRINTVSPTYSKEIQTKEFGCGIEDVLKKYKSKISGILNAIDYDVWSPADDKLLYTCYSKDCLEKKLENKVRYQREMKLEERADTLLLGMVSRLSDQKGLDILAEALPKILEKHQVTILGLGEKKHQESLALLVQRYPRRFALHLKFDEGIAHKIYAASDVFLMPSKFEPCGLSQMISFRYATLPLVNATGGLADTVIDYNKNAKKGNGFVLDAYSSASILSALHRIEAVFADKQSWQKVLTRVTDLRFSWEETTESYLEMYKKA